MGEFEAKRCGGKWHQNNLICQIGAPFALAAHQKPGEKACCRHTKAHYCLLAGDVPLAFPDPLTVSFLPVAGCKKLMSRDHINRLTPYTPPPGSCPLHWDNRSTSKRSEAGRQRGKSTASFSSSAWEPCRGRPPCDSFQLQEGRLPSTVPHSLRSSNGPPSSSFGPKKRNSASLALSNFTYPPVVSLYPLEMIPLLSSIRSIVG